jgi:hypothetical protein
VENHGERLSRSGGDVVDRTCQGEDPVETTNPARRVSRETRAFVSPTLFHVKPWESMTPASLLVVADGLLGEGRVDQPQFEAGGIERHRHERRLGQTGQHIHLEEPGLPRGIDDEVDAR